MTTVYMVDWLERKLLSRVEIEPPTESEAPIELRQSSYDKMFYFNRLALRGVVTVNIVFEDGLTDVPENLRAQSEMSISFSNDFEDKDLTVTKDALSQTLDFPSGKHRVRLDWRAVTGIALPSAREGREWKDDRAELLPGTVK